MNTIYEDSQILVVDKPAGLVVDESETQKTGTLQQILRDEYGINIERSGIVHRLDKDTSGILIVAKTKEALDNLQSQFKSRLVKKEYICLVHGFMEKEIDVQGAIARNPGNREKFIVVSDEEGKEARTRFIPISNFKFQISNFQSIFNDLNKIQMRKLEKMGYNNFTLVKCLPLTGRTHQIRVHLKYIGNPLVADEKYGGRKTFRLDKRWCPRQFLHASKIEFKHPVSGEKMNFESPLPEDLQKALSLLV